MAYTTIDDPSDYMRIQTWSGNNSADREITWTESDNMQPDWIWVKRRSDTANHRLADSVRGATKILRSDTNDAETTESDDTLSFDTNGFSVGSNSGVNKTGDTYVGWGWKAGTAFTNDASSTGIGSIDSAGSVSTDAGFSICSYTGTGSVGTVKHGLGVTPKIILFKNRTTASNWLVYHEAIGNTHNLYLDATNGKADRSDTFNDTSPTSSVFTVGTADLNTSGNSIIAYCFADVQGYSKVSGSYIGNGNADGTFVYTGFKPAFVLIKVTSTTNDWEIHDNKRGSSNVINAILQPNLSDAESTSGREIDFLSNGFKLRNSNSQNNLSGGTFIYMAFAENPFVTSTGVPATAR
jgi:hypothetical protein